MFFTKRSYSTILSIFFIVLLSAGQAHADEIDYCKLMKGKYVHRDELGNTLPKIMVVANPNNPIVVFKMGNTGQSCYAKPKGTYKYHPENKYEIAAFWMYTGEEYIKKENVYVELEQYRGSGKKTIYAKNKTELCEKLVAPAQQNYFAKNSAPNTYDVTPFWNPYRHAKITSSKGDTSTSKYKAYCQFEYLDEYKNATSTRSVIIYDIKTYEPATGGPIENLGACENGQERNEITLECELPPRKENTKCEKDATRVIEPVGILPLENISYNGCHMTKVKSSYYSAQISKKCLSVEYKATGLEAREGDYTYKKSDLSDCLHEIEKSKKCLDGFYYDYDSGMCYSLEYRPYDPDVVTDDFEPEKIAEGEEPEKPSEREETDVESEHELKEGEHIKCEKVGNEFEKETVCSVVDNADNYIRPAPLDEYPKDSAPSEGLCGNGFTGTNCDQEPVFGGSKGDASNGGASEAGGSSDGTEGVEGKLDEYLQTNEVTQIDYDSVGENIDKDEEGEDSAIDLASLLKKNKGTLLETAECPEPTTIKFFEGAEFFGAAIEKEFTLSYEYVCQFGDNYRNIYLNMFLLLLAIDLIRRLKSKE